VDNATLLKLVNTMQEKIVFLEAENTMLKERLAKYEHPKNSRNSSIPPSKDDNKPIRTKSKPDKVVPLMPHYCRSCGSDLQTADALKSQSRQVVDIPPI